MSVNLYIIEFIYLNNKNSPGKNRGSKLCTNQLQQALIKLCDLLNGGIARIARSASVVVSGLSEERNILGLYDILEVSGDTYVMGQLLYCVNGCLSVLFLGHLLGALNAHSLCDIAVLLAGAGSVVLHNGRQDYRVSNAVGSIIKRTKRVSHGVNDTKTYVREAHTSDILSGFRPP